MSAVSQFTVGRDGTLVLMLPSGQLSLNYTSFEVQQQTHAVMSRPVNSPTIPAELPDHWTAKFGIDRNSSALEDTIAATEATYWAGGNAGLNGITIYQYVNETDGSTSAYMLTGCTLKLSDAGSYKQDAIVAQTLDVVASQRVKIQ